MRCQLKLAESFLYTISEVYRLPLGFIITLSWREDPKGCICLPARRGPNITSLIA